MQQYGPENIRNVALLSHSGAGKTSASEVMLFAAGAIKRLGKVGDGSTTSDYDPDELKRQISISLSLLPCEWKGVKLNIIDIPGYSDFVGEVRAAMRVSEGAVIMICAASGVEVGTEQVWGYCDKAELPRLIFINKMDRENADFNKTVGQIQDRFGAKCLPLQLPIGAQNSFEGIVDLLTMKAYSGTDAKEAEVPAALQSQSSSFREKLMEAIAEFDDKLIEKYLEGKELSQEEVGGGLRQAIAAGKMVPILTGSALKNIGIAMLMDAIHDYLPSAKEGKVVTLSDSKEQTSEPSADSPLAALVFKTTADPYVGKLTYFRVYNGAMTSNSQVWNANRKSAERIGQLKIAPIEFPKPVFSLAVHPKTKADLDKLGAALTRMVEEDLTIEVHRVADTNETIMSGIGESQLEVAADRMQRKFGVGVKLQVPKVPYKETITVGAKAEYKHKKQTGGHGQYGHVLLELEPLPRGSGHEFADKIVGGAIPRNYVPAVEKGVNEAIQEGVLARYPVIDIRATVYDGSFHPVDSSEICFKIAGAGAFKKGLAEGQPILLEPIMNIEVTVPEDYTGDIIGDMNTKRARVQGMNPGGGFNVIEAQVPQAEILRYSIDLKSITQGRGSYKASFSHYEEVPAHVTEKIIAARQAEKSS
ncbi:MAG: elongation factor G [Chloroflexi bacterium]|nr:elongation factor G [Chloroflexota bacterium]